MVYKCVLFWAISVYITPDCSHKIIKPTYAISPLDNAGGNGNNKTVPTRQIPTRVFVWLDYNKWPAEKKAETTHPPSRTLVRIYRCVCLYAYAVLYVKHAAVHSTEWYIPLDAEQYNLTTYFFFKFHWPNVPFSPITVTNWFLHFKWYIVFIVMCTSANLSALHKNERPKPFILYNI